MDHSRVVEDLASILIEDQMLQYGLHDWTYSWHDEGSMAGRCTYASKILTFNRRVILDTAARNIMETIKHEIAHALVSSSKHDQEWYQKLIEIGGTGLWVFNDGRVSNARP